MTSNELNKKLISEIPELKEMYCQETSWQDGDDTGSHVIYGDVLVPFVKEQIKIKNEKLLKRIFVFIEGVLKQNDEYANEVIAFSVIESLIFDDEIENDLYMPFAGSSTMKIIEEITSSC